MDLPKGISLYTIPAAFFLAMTPHTYVAVAAGRSYDIAYPRKTTSTLVADDKMDKIVKMRFIRAQAATENGLETIGFYAAAVVAANAAGVNVDLINALTLSYLGTRVVYNLIYVLLQDNRAFAPLRSLSWITGVGITTALYVKAGMKLSA